jgi:hypothetical protein
MHANAHRRPLRHCDHQCEHPATNPIGEVRDLFGMVRALRWTTLRFPTRSPFLLDDRPVLRTFYGPGPTGSTITIDVTSDEVRIETATLTWWIPAAMLRDRAHAVIAFLLPSDPRQPQPRHSPSNPNTAKENPGHSRCDELPRE